MLRSSVWRAISTVRSRMSSRDCALFVHGSTVATNRMIEGKGARVGLLTTEGFRDALEIRRGLREDQWNHRKPFAPVLVPRYLRHGVRGRIDGDGSEYAPLVPEDIDAALAAFEAEGVEAFAIAFFNSFLNDRHEAEAAAHVRRRRKDAWITNSAALSPIMGEYERTSTAVVNATLAPGIVTYLRSLDVRLRELGLSRPILLVQSNGGAISVDQVSARPVNLLLSGPAAAVGALELLPPRDRRVRHRPGRRRQSHLDGDRRHLVRRHADVARRGCHERRAHDRGLSRLDSLDRHPYDRRGRRNDCRRRRRWHALRRSSGGGRSSGTGVLRPWRG